MMSKVRWRVTAPFLILVLVVMVGLMVSLSRPVCVDDSNCVKTAVFTATIFLLFSIFLLACTPLPASKTNQPTDQPHPTLA
jgi:hypothetical protein